MSFDWKGTLGAIAPWIAGALGGPAAGIAVKALCDVTGLQPSIENAQKAAELAAAGKMTGDQFLALRAAEDATRIKLQEMGFKNIEALEEIAYKDRDSARRREIEAHDSWTPRILAGLIVGGFLGAVYYVLSGRVQELRDPGVATMAGTLIGYISAKADTVYGYYFGTSASSRSKDQMLYNSTPTDGGAK